jgi:hypothetical protein
MTDEKRPGQPPEPVHQPGTEKGEEQMHKEGKEAGRHHTGYEGADRPTGKSTGRSSSGAAPEEPKEPESPNIPPP